ncbi:JAB domain-containing protein, partial [Aeromonas veronii]
IIAVHNHPSGDPEPSQSDRVFTQALKEALALVDVRLLDHLVVGAEGVVSLAERGQL